MTNEFQSYPFQACRTTSDPAPTPERAARVGCTGRTASRKEFGNGVKTANKPKGDGSDEFQACCGRNKNYKMQIVVAITGASGTIYARRLLEKLTASGDVGRIGVVVSGNARDVAAQETGGLGWLDELRQGPEGGKIAEYDPNDFSAPFASGSSHYDAMVIVPCSMGMAGRIAGGISASLTCRAADVMLKERRRLILVPRETPWSLIHLRNLTTITEAGGIIIPASPSFYSQPQTFGELADTVVWRIIALLGLPVPPGWGEGK